MTRATDEVPALRVETRPVEGLGSLLPLLEPTRPLLFVRRGEGVAGLGETLRLEFRGPDRIRDAAAAWRRIAAAAEVDDAVGLPGSGLIAFGAFAFADASPRASVLIVPRVVVGRRDGVAFVTRVDGAADVVAESPLGPEYRVRLHHGASDPDAYRAAVTAAIERIRAGAAEKIVLARDIAGHLPDGADLRRVLVDLALGYPDTWTYAVDGLLGSSPETLVRVGRGRVSARVLAGSIGRGADADADHAAAVRLATSTKDLDEHRYAVESVLQALEPHARAVVASEMPYALKLPNLWHLATDVEGVLSDGSTSLDLVAELHPTAAVAGTPRAAALAEIARLEPIDRGLYSGPVGWVDRQGDGKWAIALRSAEVEPGGDVRAFAGAGIVASSDPERELAETKLKFQPVADAFA